MRKRLTAQNSARKKQNVPAEVEGMDEGLKTMLIAEMPELGRMTAGEAAAMTSLAPMSHDSGTMRRARAIAGGRRALRHVLFQAALAAA